MKCLQLTSYNFASAEIFYFCALCDFNFIPTANITFDSVSEATLKTSCCISHAKFFHHSFVDIRIYFAVYRFFRWAFGIFR